MTLALWPQVVTSDPEDLESGCSEARSLCCSRGSRPSPVPLVLPRVQPTQGLFAAEGGSKAEASFLLWAAGVLGSPCGSPAAHPRYLAGHRKEQQVTNRLTG